MGLNEIARLPDTSLFFGSLISFLFVRIISICFPPPVYFHRLHIVILSAPYLKDVTHA